MTSSSPQIDLTEEDISLRWMFNPIGIREEINNISIVCHANPDRGALFPLLAERGKMMVAGSNMSIPQFMARIGGLARPTPMPFQPSFSPSNPLANEKRKMTSPISGTAQISSGPPVLLQEQRNPPSVREFLASHNALNNLSLSGGSEPAQMDFSNDIVISQLNETEYQLEMEEMKRKRRSKINPPETLVALRESGEEEEDNILLYEGSSIADLCELMVGEKSSGGLIRALQEQKREGEAVLIQMMMKRGLRPVKMSDWAEVADFDEYYMGTYAREVCNLFPPGIVKMKDGNFVMGDALTKYVNIAKAIYTHETMAILDEKEKMNEKEITTNLGISSLEGFLSMKTFKDIFYMEKINGELVVSMIV